MNSSSRHAGPFAALSTAFAVLAIATGGGQSSAAERPITLREIYGNETKLTDYREPTTKATVLVFMDPYCPVVQQYAPTLRSLYRRYNAVERDRAGRPVRRGRDGQLRTYKYAGDRVCFLGIYPTPGVSHKDMAAHALELGLPFRVLRDHRQAALKRFGVTELAEVVVLDAAGKALDQGTIDDQHFPGGSKPAPTEHYLRDVLDKLVAGKKVEPSKRPPQGCHIASLEDAAGGREVSFHKDIEPILQQNCQKCHRPGEVGPMPLVSYDDAANYAEMIREVVVDKRMPPWPGKSSRRLKDHQELTGDEISTIVDWVRGGKKRGNPADAPPAKDWPPRGQWKIGEPDVVLEMPEPFRVPASGLIDYVYYPLKAGFPEDRYIQAIEVLPGAPQVVHHIQAHEYPKAIKPGETRGLNALEQLMLYGPAVDGAKLLGSYTPGNNANARFYGKEAGMKLSKGANLILELHYTPNGRPATDRTRVGIVFTKQKPEREIKTHYFLRKRGDFVIPSNAGHHSMQHLYHFEKPVKITSVRPHMHVRGKSFRLELVDSASVRLRDIHDRAKHLLPQGEVLLTIPIWDFNWQRTYEFDKPIIVPRGKALLATAFWDNTRHNPRNPNWRNDAPWGQQIKHEMFNMLFLYEELPDGDGSSATAGE